jgi:protein-S-isoprenylcysteine O-methyltransferase
MQRNPPTSIQQQLTNMLASSINTNRSTPTSPDTYIHSVLLSFTPVASIFLLTTLINTFTNPQQTGLFLYLLLIYTIFIIANIAAYITLSSLVELSIYWRSCLLTNTFLIGFLISSQTIYPSLVCFGCYLMCLSFFHLSEFVVTALFNQTEVSTDSFLINHSWEYGLAMLMSWLEFFLEAMIVPAMKINLYVRFFGLFLVMFGELFRKLAMYTCGSNFNHYVQEKRKTGHILIKSGVYSLVRHPSYFGWFYWSIGTQILLANPICTVLYAISSWKFFSTRITYEEFHLIKFFGKEYSNYQRKVSTGMPFIRGYVHYGEESLD